MNRYVKTLYWWGLGKREDLEFVLSRTSMIKTEVHDFYLAVLLLNGEKFYFFMKFEDGIYSFFSRNKNKVVKVEFSEIESYMLEVLSCSQKV